MLRSNEPTYTARIAPPLQMYLLYQLAIVVYAVLAAPRLLVAMVRHGKYRGTLAERWGRLPAKIDPGTSTSIWLHGVSVGEVMAARALVPVLRDRYPGHPLYLSTTTETGRQVAEGVEGLDGVFYFPFDLSGTVQRVLDQVRPMLVVTVDTELWPNLLRHCRIRGIRTVLVNGRISDRSYPRYRLVRWFFRHVLQALDLACMQSEASARRLIAIGALADRVEVTGNLKFDALEQPTGLLRFGADGVQRTFRLLEGRAVVVAASTHPGEEPYALDAFEQVAARDPSAILVLAPRHPERADDVMTLVVGRGHPAVRRTELPFDRELRARVIVLDTVGELASLYELATVVFLGGSLVPHGGHNVLEPAVRARPVVFGPHMHNFAEIADLFLASRAALQITEPTALGPTLLRLLEDPVERASLGAAAQALVTSHRGATDRCLTLIEGLIPPTRSADPAVMMRFPT